MKERFMMLFIFLTLFILLVDLYSFKGIKLLASNIDSQFIKYTIFVVYWIIPLFIISTLLYFRTLEPFEREPRIFKRFFLLAGFFILFYIPKLLFITFHLVDDIVHLIKIVANKFAPNTEIVENVSGEGISRAKFISQLGLLLAAIPFTSILYGMAKGRFNFRISHEKLSFPNLPDEFDNFKIVQISDMHIGSFLGHENQVKKGIELISQPLKTS